MRLALAVLLIASPAAAQVADPIARGNGDYIRQAGFDCPVAKVFEPAGPTAHGDSYRIVCGPADGSDRTIAALTFRLTFRPHGGVYVEAWRD